jgi:hypothetical protein
MALLFAFGYFPPEWPMNGCPNQHFESVATPQETALHAPAASQHAGATFDSSPKLLRALEAPAFLVGCALGGVASAALRNALQRHAGSADQCDVGRAVKATVGCVNPRHLAEVLTVTLQGWLDLHLVDRIAVEDLVVGNQSAPTFGQQDLVAELHWGVSRGASPGQQVFSLSALLRIGLCKSARG